MPAHLPRWTCLKKLRCQWPEDCRRHRFSLSPPQRVIWSLMRVQYEDLSVPLYGSDGYSQAALWSVMSKHLKDLMSDSEVYGWAPVCTYYTVWLQQIEKGRAKWTDSDAKLEFCRALMWHAKSAPANQAPKEACCSQRQHDSHHKARHSCIHFLQQVRLHATG